MTYLRRVINGQLVSIQLGRVTPQGVDYGGSTEPATSRVHLHRMGVYGTVLPTRLRVHGAAVFGDEYVELDPVDAVLRLHAVRPEGLAYIAQEPEPEAVLMAHQVGPITL